jgi:hypothetical protein
VNKHIETCLVFTRFNGRNVNIKNGQTSLAPPSSYTVLEPSGMEMNVRANTVTLLYLNELEVLQIEGPILKFDYLSQK